MIPDDFTGERAVTTRLLHGIFDGIARGLDEAGMPLTEAQVAFLAKASTAPLL